VWGCIDEVGEGDEGGGEADCGAVEGCDEDFGVRVELDNVWVSCGLGDVGEGMEWERDVRRV
jgi:hypothetical protein